MISIFFILLSLVAIITAFSSPQTAWIILGAAAIGLLLILLGAKNRKIPHVPELSGTANEMMQKFGHYYSMPVAGAAFSGAASGVLLAGAIVAIIGFFSSYWIGFLFMAVNWICMGLISRAFNPTQFLVDVGEQQAHDEIIEWIQSR